ncbi:hypothetical protein D3C78_1410090 [compost metagenome]
MQEAEGCRRLAWQLPVIGTYGFKHAEGTNDVGLNEILRTMNRAIHMGFGREVDHRTRLMLFQQFSD